MNENIAISELLPGDRFTRTEGPTVMEVVRVRAGQRYTEVEYTLPGCRYPGGVFHAHSLTTVTVL